MIPSAIAGIWAPYSALEFFYLLGVKLKRQRDWLGFPEAAIFLHNRTIVLRRQIHMNAFWCGTHQCTGDSGNTLPSPMLLPSSPTREMAFVLAHSIVHHSGTKRLNQVARSNSPWGFCATETGDYRLTVPVLQRTPLWHSTMCKPFSNTSPQCKAGTAPWDFSVMVRKKIQESIRRLAPRQSAATLTMYWKCSIHKKNEGEEDYILRGERIPSSTQVISSAWVSGIQNWCQSVFIQLFRGSAGAADAVSPTPAPAALNISCLSNFYTQANDSEISIPSTNQNTMSLASHVWGAPAPDMLSSFFCLINQ